MRILLLDDDAGLGALLRTTFEAVDVELEEADDGPAATEAVRRHRPDVVVLDVHMPGGSGLDLCRDLKADPATDGICLPSQAVQPARAPVDRGAARGRVAPGARRALSWASAGAEILRQRGGQFDPAVVRAFQDAEPRLRAVYADLSAA